VPPKSRKIPGKAMKTGQKRHPNFKGGTITEPRGYVLRFVGKAHHLADCRGYAYEHRLRAEEKLGRRLRPGEVVHHDNEKPGDNSDRNLIPKANNAIHLSEHFRKRSDLRPLDAPNPEIKCACGCGRVFLKYDYKNRPRKYVAGHHRKGKPRTWDAKPWSKLGEYAAKQHLAKCRHIRWNSSATRRAIKDGR
jgi:hypothetical protein